MARYYSKITNNDLRHILRVQAADVHHALTAEEILEHLRIIRPEAVSQEDKPINIRQRLQRMAQREPQGFVGITSGKPFEFYYRVPALSEGGKRPKEGSRADQQGSRADQQEGDLLPLHETMTRLRDLRDLLPSLEYYLDQFLQVGRVIQGRGE